MKLTLKRIALRDTYTVGRLFINDQYFCDTLEDKVRDTNHDGVFDDGEKKIFGETAIPYGTYNITMKTYSPKFKKIMPRLLNVPSFEGILIHGVLPNVIARPKHTEGCILVGKNTVKGGLTDAYDTSKKIREILKDADDRGEELTITIE